MKVRPYVTRSEWARFYTLLCSLLVPFAASKKLFGTWVHGPGVGLYCVDLPRAPFVSWSHLQHRLFVLYNSRTTAENSLSPVSLLLSPR